MNGKLLNIGYLFGISLVLAGIFYFFASNWQGFDRLTKVFLSMGILVIFYLLSLLLSLLMKNRLFLSRWGLTGAAISFGIAVGLIGQIYNSHADSYLLFAVWMVPVLLLGLLTKYPPFYLLGFILFHLAFYFYVYPSSYFIRWTETQLLLLVLLLIGVDIVLFVLALSKQGAFNVIKYASFVISQFLLIYLSFSESFPTYGVWLNILFLLNVATGIFYFMKLYPRKSQAAGFILSFAVYLISKGFELIIHFLGEALFVFMLLFSGALVVVSIKVLRNMDRFMSNNDSLRKAVSVSVIIIATIFSVVSIVGLIALTFMDFPIAFLFSFAMIVLVVPGLLLPYRVEVPHILKYTAISTGYSIALGSSLFSDGVSLKIILLIAAVAGSVIAKSNGLKVIQHIVANLSLLAFLVELLNSFHWVALCLVIFNAAFYFLFIKESGIRKTAFLGSLGFFISLTIADSTPPLLYWAFNISYFIFITSLVLLAKRKRMSFEFFVSLVFWFLFIGYKYYDLAWDLVHKSVLFFAVGVLFLVFTFFLDRNPPESPNASNFVLDKWKAISLVLLLQAGFIGYQIFMNEKLLEEGTAIKLELAPVDPRSLLQGDYVTLNYDISQNPALSSTGLPGEKIQLLLRPEGDVYRYGGFYKYRGNWNRSYEEQSHDVIINGVIGGDGRVIFGIESYFVEEGTGLEIESDVDYAIVKVAHNGNAILVELK